MKKILFSLILSVCFVAAYSQSIIEGIKHMENENYAAALEVFSSICKADPKDYAANFYTGEVYYLMEENRKAEDAYKKGLSVNSQCAECYIGLGKLELDKGNTVEAEKNFKTAINIKKKSADIQGLIGDAYLYSKKPNASKAIEHLTNAKDMNPANARFWAHLGEAYELSGNHGEAMSSYETAVEKDPKNVEAVIRMARIWARAKRVEHAVENLEKAMHLAPDDARPIKDLYELYIQQQKYDKVIPLLEKYISLIGTDIDAQVRLVKFLTFQAKDFDRAIERGEKLIRSNPDQYTLYRWLAWSYAAKAKTLEGDKPPKVMEPAVRELYLKAHENIIKLFDELGKDSKRKAFPEDYEIWALTELKVGSLEKAAHVYRKYIEFEPGKAPEIHGNLAKAYFDSTNYVQAIAYYKRKHPHRPLTVQEEYYLGLSHLRLKQYHAADSSFIRILEKTPDYAQGWFQRATINERIDSTQTLYLAKPFYEKYIELTLVNPEKIQTDSIIKKNLINAYYYLGVYAAKHDDFNTAIQYFEKVVELDPTNEDALKNIKLLKER